jgi:glycosyltransferase involved in cell wall biosynthesis
VELLAPPTFPEDFARARRTNLVRTGRPRFLHHIIGKPAHGDRNGTMLLMHAMQRSRGNYELIVKSQEPIQRLLPDNRITWDHSAPEEQQALYEGFDAMVMPRRYDGLSLPCNESLMSALPVIMSHTSPNNVVLPPEWLVPGQFRGGFVAGTPIQYVEADINALARKLDELTTMPEEQLRGWRSEALARSAQFDPATLKPKYQAAFA